MSERFKVSVLIVLGVVLAAAVFYAFVGGPQLAVGTSSAASDSYQAIAVDNPALHLDRIERLRKLEYKPTGRDIFTSELPPPPPPKKDPRVPPPKGPDEPPPPPALVVPFKYYGFSDDIATKKRSGFFTNGEEVFIAVEGQTLQGKYRVVTLSTAWADVEEVSTSRRARLTMEGQATSPQGDSLQR
ncbi:MAG TPA: hypothetical protein VMI93_11610 [Candidatus Solibacter sp.]|nr:hypothetical protein [Candidatus Solibacter sp.]